MKLTTSFLDNITPIDMKLSYCFVLWFILAQSSLFSQNVTVTVYNNDGTTEELTTKDFNYLKYTEGFKVSKEGLSGKRVLELSDNVSHVEIQNKGRYILAKDKEDNNLLMYVKMEGPISLLYHGQSDIYALKDGELHQLEQVEEGNNLKRKYRRTAASLVQDDHVSVKKAGLLEFKKDDILDLFQEYNRSKSNGEKVKVYNPSSPTKIRPIVGIGFRNDETFDNNRLALFGTNFQSYFISAEITISDSDFSDNFFLTTGVWYLSDSYEIESFREERQEIVTQTVVVNGNTVTRSDTMTVIESREGYAYSSTAFEVPLYVEFNNRKNIISPYAAFGGSIKRRQLSRDFEVTEDISESVISLNLLLEGGAAINIVDKLLFTATYNFDTGLNFRGRFSF